nr:MAG TPA: hypothetical protein [Caudoviricetes sp.]
MITIGLKSIDHVDFSLITTVARHPSLADFRTG